MNAILLITYASEYYDLGCTKKGIESLCKNFKPERIIELSDVYDYKSIELKIRQGYLQRL